jgi:hypothetical protein
VTTTTTNVFAVVGQAVADPDRLLLLGEDGHFYAYAADGQPRPVNPTAGWRLDGEVGAEAQAEVRPGARPGAGRGADR